MTKFDNLIDRIKLAGRRTAESWLGSVAPDQGAHEARVRAMTACLSSVIVTPLFSAPVLLMTFSWPLAVAGALAVAAASMAIAGLLAATGSLVMTARASLAIAGVALGVLAVCSGGLASPFLPLLVLLPLESAIRSSRLSGFGQGLLTSLATSAAVLAADAAGLAFAMPQGAFAAAALALALYVMARGLASALSAPSLEPQTAVVESKPAPVVDEASILDQLPGLVTLHDPHGGVHRVAGADHAGFTGRIGNLAGKGFVSRIHVADRIAFLDALETERNSVLGWKGRDCPAFCEGFCQGCTIGQNAVGENQQFVGSGNDRLQGRERGHRLSG